MYQYDFIQQHYSYHYIIPMQLWLSSKMILFADNRARWDYFFDKAISNPFFDLWSIQIINGHRWIVWPLGSSKTSRSLNIRFSESRSSFSEREKKEQISKSKHPQNALNHYKAFSAILQVLPWRFVPAICNSSIRAWSAETLKRNFQLTFNLTSRFRRW
jgi:hypothetical protein